MDSWLSSKDLPSDLYVTGGDPGNVLKYVVIVILLLLVLYCLYYVYENGWTASVANVQSYFGGSMSTTPTTSTASSFKWNY